MVKIVDYTAKNPRLLFLNLATAIGYLGGFPEPPKIFYKILESYPLIRWVLVTLLIYQGGGEQDIQLAVELTIILFLLDHIIKAMENSKDKEKKVTLNPINVLQ